MVTDLGKVIIHQCSWCKCNMIDGERIEDCDIVPESHGICKVCACSLEMQCMDTYGND